MNPFSRKRQDDKETTVRTLVEVLKAHPSFAAMNDTQMRSTALTWIWIKRAIRDGRLADDA